MKINKHVESFGQFNENLNIMHIIDVIESFINGEISFEKFKEESYKTYKHYLNEGEVETFFDLIHEPLLCLNQSVTDDIYHERWRNCEAFFKTLPQIFH